jgi:hypothetical protein
MALALLSEPLVLRSTRELGDFEADALMAKRLGRHDARFRLERLSPTEYLVADHPMPLDRVYVAGERTLSWELELRSDDSGNTWQVVKFAAPIALEDEVTATGTGQLNPDTGALIENPADMMAYVMALHGRPDIVFPDLRAEAAAEGLRLKISLDSTKAAKTWLDEIALSAGAIWTPSASRLYPNPETNGAVIELTPYYASGLETPVSTIADACDVLRIAYDRSDATGRAQHAITLRASPQRFGGVVAELTLPHLWLPSNAETVGRRLLSRMAARRVTFWFDCRRSDIRAGQWLRLVDNPEWKLTDTAPLCMVLDADIAANARRSRLFVEVVLSTPTIEVIAHSVGLSDVTEGGVDVSFRDGAATFSFRDEEGRPVRGVRVTIDGSDTRLSGDDGRVSFTPAQGEHDVRIERSGFEPLQTSFVMP